MSDYISPELRKKLNSFIQENTKEKTNPLSRKEVEVSIVELKNGGVTYDKILKFLKKEFNIEVTVQAVQQKYKSLTSEKKDK